MPDKKFGATHLSSSSANAEPTCDDAEAATSEDQPLGLQPQEAPASALASKPTEIVIGLVGPLGTDSEKIRRLISDRLKAYTYVPHEVRISAEIIPEIAGEMVVEGKYEKAKALIDLGDKIRRESGNNGVLAVAASAKIAEKRPTRDDLLQRNAYIVSSLKRPEEVAELRRIYAGGFYLFAIHTDRDRRLRHLSEDGEGMSFAHATELLELDEHEAEEGGQRTRDTFHLADFFLADENNEDKLRFSIWRCLDLIFGKPWLTPTFNEFAMFMAFSASLRSADLSRQVGAVVTKAREILSTGANDCPTAGGGLYWPVFLNNRVEDVANGRDYKRGFDSNSREKTKLIQAILEKFPEPEREKVERILRESPISDLTEFGRVVHAEMEALLACARSHVSCMGGRLFCTTFPCHNCAKHIIAAGIEEVIYVEPYPKSKALEFHEDSATTKRLRGGRKRLRFKPFVGVGPRSFFDLFSLSLSSGRTMVRKKKDGDKADWVPAQGLPRVRMLPASYVDFEAGATKYWNALKPEIVTDNEKTQQ